MSEDRPEYKTGKKRLSGLADKASKRRSIPIQREVEMKLLAALASVINSDLAVLKYDLLDMNETDFLPGSPGHLRRHEGADGRRGPCRYGHGTRKRSGTPGRIP